jgi:hypothetical protein
MMRVVRPEEIPTKQSMRDKEEGTRLQKLANAMLMRGDTGDDYVAIRNAAEKHLGIWDWQDKVPTWKRVGVTKPMDLRPIACSRIGDDNQECAYLPAGSPDCRAYECPSA